MLDPLSKAAYEAAQFGHEVAVQDELARIDMELQEAAAVADQSASEALRTMRILLQSGLFDRDFYLDKYPDVCEAGVDPLRHYVEHGDREGRMPNPVFSPSYYRRTYLGAHNIQPNTLAHYIELGERAGYGASSVFDPLTYLARHPRLSEFVDRPLFHYLRVGSQAADDMDEAPLEAACSALQYDEAVTASGIEEHYALVKAKRSFVASRGIERGFALYRQLVGRRAEARIELKPIQGLRDAAAAVGAAFHEVAAGGEPYVVPAPRLIGAGERRELKCHTRSMFVACLIDARVRARSNAIALGEAVIFDYEGDELTRFDDRLDYDPAIFHAIPGAAWVIAPENGSETIQIEEAFTLLGVYADAFGHWMIEFLPKYLAAVLSGALPRVPLLIESGMPQTHRQALDLMITHEVGIIELPPFATAHVRRLWCAPTQSHFPIWEIQNERFRREYFALPPARFVPIIYEMARRLDHWTAEPTGMDRVYLARKSYRHRKLVNHAAIESVAKARGFTPIYSEEMDFAEQARVLRHARYVLGPSGSAMFLLYFSRNGTKLCFLSSEEQVGAAQMDLVGPLLDIGIDVTLLTGPCVRLDTELRENCDYEIDEGTLCHFLDEWLAGEPIGPRNPVHIIDAPQCPAGSAHG